MSLRGEASSSGNLFGAESVLSRDTKDPPGHLRDPFGKTGPCRTSKVKEREPCHTHPHFHNKSKVVLLCRSEVWANKKAHLLLLLKKVKIAFVLGENKYKKRG